LALGFLLEFLVKNNNNTTGIGLADAMDKAKPSNFWKTNKSPSRKVWRNWTIGKVFYLALY